MAKSASTVILPQTEEKKPSPEKIIALIHYNLEAIRLFYKSTSSGGPHYGINTTMEEVVGVLSFAVELAIKGQKWKPAGK
jgi:hypothetical protein